MICRERPAGSTRHGLGTTTSVAPRDNYGRSTQTATRPPVLDGTGDSESLLGLKALQFNGQVIVCGYHYGEFPDATPLGEYNCQRFGRVDENGDDISCGPSFLHSGVVIITGYVYHITTATCMM